jgi:hypothetical protein
MPREPKTAPETEEPIKRVMVRMPDSLHHRLRLLAVERRTTMEEIVRAAVTREIETATRGRAA